MAKQFHIFAVSMYPEHKPRKMDPIFNKLNYKAGQTIHVLNEPEVFSALLAGVVVSKEIAPENPVEFIIVFATKKADLEEQIKTIAPTLAGDALVWIAYPKGTSKKYTCDFNRDTSWQIMEPYGLMPVRQIAIDEDWSALRFRKAEYIKNSIRK
jgi:hypothetical protein